MNEFLCRSCGEWTEGEPMLMDVVIGVVSVCRSCWEMPEEAEECFNEQLAREPSAT